MRILLAEDDPFIRKGLAEVFLSEGYDVLEAQDGAEALERYHRDAPDFLCLDIMMPGLSGFEICKAVRALNRAIPIIFISARTAEVDCVIGLELGADDYIVKPFGVSEVLSRVRAVTRRYLMGDARPDLRIPDEFQLGDVRVQTRALKAMLTDREVELSFREIKLLHLFWRHQDVVLSRESLFTECWGERYHAQSRTLDQHISKLRKKLGSSHATHIQTLHGLGYRYVGKQEPSSCGDKARVAAAGSSSADTEPILSQTARATGECRK